MKPSGAILTKKPVEPGPAGAGREWWLAWQAVRIAARFRMRPAVRGLLKPLRPSGLGSDLRFAVRALRGQPLSTAGIVLTLALGIGATTAVYAVFSYAVFRPVPGTAESDLLVSVLVAPDHTSTWRGTLTHAHLQTLRTMPAFETVAAYNPAEFPVQPEQSAVPKTVKVTTVTAGFFDLLRARPRIGRLFAPDEYEAEARNIAIISENFWRASYDDDPAVVGRTLWIRGQPFTIVGVIRAFRGLGGLSTANLSEEDVWIPFGASAILRPDGEPEHQWMIGRLRPAVSLDVARAQAAQAVASIGPIQRRDQTYTAVVFPGVSDGLGITRGRLMRVYWTAMAGVAVLFLLACANGANLLLSRNIRRSRDLALKGALGAGRARLIRELLVEASLIAGLAGALGLAASAAMTGLFRAERLLSYLPTLENLSFDWRVALCCTLLSAATVLVAAGLPSLLASRRNAQAALRDHTRGMSRGARRIQRASLAFQIALSFALLASAGVLAQTLMRLEHTALGFDSRKLMAVELRPSTIGFDRTQTARLFRESQTRLAATPGIDGVTFGWASHLGAQQFVELQTPDGRISKLRAHARSVSSTYLTTLGIPLVSGRMFTDADDRPGGPRVAVLDESLARTVFGGVSPLGGTFLLMTAAKPIPYEVIGVARDSAGRDLRNAHRPALFLPQRDELRIATLQVRSQLPDRDAITLIRDVVHEIAPALAVHPAPVAEEIAALIAEERLLAKLGLVIACLALGIAVAGVYAGVACRVADDAREYGIRVALGATRADVQVGIVRRIVAAAGAGMLAGLAAYAWASTFLAARLFQVSPLDPMTLSVAAATLMTAIIVASWIPARRAGRVDPAIALKAN